MAAEAEQLAEVLRALLKAELLKNDIFFKFRGARARMLQHRVLISSSPAARAPLMMTNVLFETML